MLKKLLKICVNLVLAIKLQKLDHENRLKGDLILNVNYCQG